MVDLARAIAEAGQPVDLVVSRAERHVDWAPRPGLQLVNLNVRAREVRAGSFIPLVRYFRRRDLAAVIPVFDYLEPVVIAALKVSRPHRARTPRLIYTIHSSIRFLRDMPLENVTWLSDSSERHYGWLIVL